MKNYTNTTNLIGWIQEQQHATLFLLSLNVDNMSNAFRMKESISEFQKDMFDDTKALYVWSIQSEFEKEFIEEIFAKRVSSLEEAEENLTVRNDALTKILTTKQFSFNERLDLEKEQYFTATRLMITQKQLDFYIDYLYS